MFTTLLATAVLGISGMTGQIDAAGVQRLDRMQWEGHRASGSAPSIRVSPSYDGAAAIAARWSAFFQSLVHGQEISLLDAYIAPLDEVQAICGGEGVLGCYGQDHLVIPDQGYGGFDASSIAAHEYGHHVAFNRLNTPWPAIDWGTKRWATYQRICPRAAAGTAFPGAEDANYSLNPGEAFAETYRALNETDRGMPITWPIVDASFRPDAAALEAVRRDVLDPWTPRPPSVSRLRFASRARTWSRRISTPLDGSLEVQVAPGSDEVTLLGDQPRTVLGRGSWTSSGTKTIDSVVCGRRAYVLRVNRHTAALRFTVRLSAP